MTASLLSAAAVVTADGLVGDAVLIDGGSVVEVGWSRDLRKRAAMVYEHPLHTIVPGLRDAHIHLAGWSASIGGLDLSAVDGFGRLRDEIRTHAGSINPATPVIGTGLDDTRLREGRMPTRHDLDRILSARPILVYRHCSHAAAANTAALEMAGIGPDTPDPTGGVFDRTATGEPTGVLREAAIGVVQRALEPLVRSPLPSQLLETSRALVRLGITRIEAMVSAGTPLWCGTGNELEDLLAIAADLPLDVDAFVMTDQIGELRRAADRIRRVGGRLRFGGWKGFADGSLGGRTAALSAPYEGEATTGMLLFENDRDLPLARCAVDEGGRVALHAIGDRAIAHVLGGFRALRDEGIDADRLRIEHCSMVDDASLAQMVELGVTASVQPPFLTSDGPWLATRIGSRESWIHPFRTMLEAGVPLRAGSDAPIEDPTPFKGIWSATSHPSNPAESLATEQALSIYGASTPRPGAPADLILVDRNPLETTRIEESRVQAVWKSGVRVS